MSVEFEMSFNGWTSKGILDAIGVLAEHSVNLSTVMTFKQGDRRIVRFISGSEEEVRKSLMKADLDFKERKVVVVDMPNVPGEWLRVARALVDAGVEIESSYQAGRGDTGLAFVFGVDDPLKAKKACSTLRECSVD